MKIYPLFIPHLGCKYNCIYCNQKEITGKYSNKNLLKNISLTIENFNNKFYDQLAIYGTSFTCLNLDLQKKILNILNKKIGINYKNIRISTYPECINQEILDMLKKHGVKTIELGIQSFDEKILYYNGRPIKTKKMIESVKLIKKNKFQLGVQIMLGLYKSDLKADIKTIKKSLMYKPDFLRVYPLVVLKNTILEKYFFNKQYQPLTKEQILYISNFLFDLLQKYPKTKLIRFGLHSDISLQKNIVAGFYHNSIKELIISNYIFNKIKKNTCKKNQIIIKLNKKCVNFIYGHKNYYKNKYKDLNVLFKFDNRLNKNKVFILKKRKKEVFIF